MFVPLCIKTDYSLLKSLIRTKDLVSYLKNNNFKACALCDDHLYGGMDFYTKCKKEGIKPIVGLDVVLHNSHLYLYAMNYNGYQNLLKINTIIQERDLAIVDLELYSLDVLCIIPFLDALAYGEVKDIFKDLYIGYVTEYEKNNALVITKNVVYVRDVRALTLEDSSYLDYLLMIEQGMPISEFKLNDYSKNYMDLNIEVEDIKTTNEVADKLNLEFPKDTNYIPIFDEMKDSYNYLVTLAKKGLEKRLDGKVTLEYFNRLQYEIDIINKMGYVDYFLIVYDYVKFAKKNNILVGPGRGSAAGSLVSYSLGITNVDPIKYDLLFERFLNPERISMPDIDIDFEYTKRDQVIEYLKKRYSYDSVASIMTFGTLGSKQVIRDVGKILEIEPVVTDSLCKIIDPTLNIESNMKKAIIKDFVWKNRETTEVFKIALKLEGIKRHVSTHAAGVVIANRPLDSIIPIYKNHDTFLTGLTMEYLEEMGLLKMDLLALKNLTIIANVLELIKENTAQELDLSSIALDDEKTINLFKNVDTVGIFQYESQGMKNFLAKLKPDSFNDIVAAVALFRPGPMENIDSFINRKYGKERIEYIVPELEPILKDTYGIIVYQEQIMEILRVMGGYSYAEADNIRRAMSKKKLDVMQEEEKKFVLNCINKGYSEDKARSVYNLILKFANYGFNKAHSVSYALIGYQMAYLKTNYPVYFIANLLNMSIGSEVKTKEYLDEARMNEIKLIKPEINESLHHYGIRDDSLILPLSIIKTVGIQAATIIIEEREKGLFEDFFDFVARVYGKSVTRKTIEMLINADAFRSFNVNHASLFSSLDSAINYAELAQDLDLSLIMKPTYILVEEFEESVIISKELVSFGFYISNHPVAKYQSKSLTKIENIRYYFDKRVVMIVLVAKIKKIKTKKNEDMAFLTCSDDTGTCDFTVFANAFDRIQGVEPGDIMKFSGIVVKRYDKYQINVKNIEKVK